MPQLNPATAQGDSTAAGLSLLSLSIAAANAAPIPVSREASNDSSMDHSPTASGHHNAGDFAGIGSYNGPSSLSNGSLAPGSKLYAAHKHRRLSSAGLARRRMSDAREATSRPSPVTLQTAASTLSSLAALSLSGSPPPRTTTTTTFATAAGALSPPSSTSISVSQSRPTVANNEDFEGNDGVQDKVESHGISMNTTRGGNGKKRAIIFKCESCSKVYRHPSCLIKHRWEHSPHWREASKFLLSKHQQVQLLEAAAILSHLSPSSGGTSLPEDRSLWPSYLSGGTLPPPTANTVSVTTTRPSPSTFDHPTASSVPVRALSSGRAASAGPRMHDYTIPASANGAAGVTHFRPGVLGVPTGSSASPSPSAVSLQMNETNTSLRAIPVPAPVHAYRDDEAHSFVSASSEWDSIGYTQSSYRSSASYTSNGYGGIGGWSLPRSSVRSGSRSRSGSMSGSEYVDVDIDSDLDLGGNVKYGFASRGRRSAMRGSAVEDEHRQEKIEEEWDGMEMEMEM